ncbi:uncharacterized protein LOC141637255 [Silene latifolia]|uniref:uncharacterized protein LOC141637255 n=1 Tax=Silene latifolia TaxID=37657 RepID=UPI003D788446
MEFLSRQLSQAEKKDMLTGLKISRYAPTFSHLFYADDAVLCFKATPESFEVLRDLFKEFESASGQMINLNKSFIKFSPNAPTDFKSHLRSILKMKSSSSFGTYLGVTVDIPRNRSQVFHPIIDKLTTRITSWSSLHLSQPCKLLVISAILFASLNHLIAALPFPLGICRKIDSLIAAFWGAMIGNDILYIGSSARLYMHLKITGIACVATIFSLVWYLSCGGCNLIDYLLENWKRKKDKLVCKPLGAGCIPLRRVTTDTEPTPDLSDLLLPSGDWNTAVIFRLFDPSTAKLIIAMEPPLPGIDDFLYWKFIEDGNYSIKTVYLYLWHKSFGMSSSSLLTSFPWSCIWQLPGSTKFSLLFWWLAHNIMPISTNLNELGVPISLVCHLCDSSAETTDHLFRSCTIAQHVWQSSALGISSQANAAISFTRWLADLVSYLSHQSSGSYNPLLYFGCVLQAIWSVRNSVVFHQCHVDSLRICQLADHLFSSHQKFPETWRSLTGSTSLVPNPIPTLFPPKSTSEAFCFYVLVDKLNSNNCYYASISNSLTGGNHLTFIKASSTLAASTRALLITMRRAQSAGYTSVSFSISCRKLSVVLAQLLPVPICGRNSVHEIRHLFVIYPFWW